MKKAYVKRFYKDGIPGLGVSVEIKNKEFVTVGRRLEAAVTGRESLDVKSTELKSSDIGWEGASSDSSDKVSIGENGELNT